MWDQQNLILQAITEPKVVKNSLIGTRGRKSSHEDLRDLPVELVPAGLPLAEGAMTSSSGLLAMTTARL